MGRLGAGGRSMTIILPRKKYTRMLKIGDLVRWSHVYDIAHPLRRENRSAVIGIIVDMRFSKERLRGDVFLRPKHGKQHQAQVLCKSGKLVWYALDDLQPVDEYESW